jgi:hypothetical protein
MVHGNLVRGKYALNVTLRLAFLMNSQLNAMVWITTAMV